MTAKLTLIACAILACSLYGCSLTLGPVTEKKAVIVQSGTGVEILENRTVRCHLLSDKDGTVDELRQDIGGWVAMHPDHWQAVKSTIARLRQAYKAERLVNGGTLTREDLDLLGEAEK